MKTQDDEVDNDFEHYLPSLAELVKILNQKVFSQEKIIQIENLNAEYEACTKVCKVRLGNIKKVYQIEHNYSQESLFCNNSSPPESQASAEKYISDQFCSVDISKWNFFFLNEKDWHFVNENFTRFFTKKSYNSTQKTMLKNGCKGQLCYVLHDIYYHFLPGSPLKNNHPFLALVKNLSPFNTQNLSQIYSNIQRYRYIVFLLFANFFDFFDTLYKIEL